jgi:DNA polymerase III delta prime subunit
MLDELAEQLFVSLEPDSETAARKKNLDAPAVLQILRGETSMSNVWYLNTSTRPARLAVLATSYGFALVGRVFGNIRKNGTKSLGFVIDEIDEGFTPDQNWSPLTVSLGRPSGGRRLYKPQDDWLGQLVDLVENARGAPLVSAARAFVQHQLTWQAEQADKAERRFQIEADGWVCLRCKVLQPGGSSRCKTCDRPIHKYGVIVLLDRPVRLQEQADVLLTEPDGHEREGIVVKGEGLRRRWLIRLKEYGRVGAGTIRPRPQTAVLDAQSRILSDLSRADLSYAPIAQLLVEPGSIAAPEIRVFGNPKTSLNTSQRRAVMGAMNLHPGGILLVQGPPGTGKTTSIVEAVREILEEIDPYARILMSSHSNTAVDSAQEKLGVLTDLRVVRVADPDKVDDKFEETVVSKCDDARVYQADVVLGTVNRLALCDWDDDFFDWLILDEANKVRINEMLPLLRLAKRWLLVGDHRQLPPVVDESAAGFNGDSARARVRDASFFEIYWEPLSSNKRLMLGEQYRMAEPIGNFVSKAFYEGQLRNAAGTEKLRSPLAWPFNKNLTWLTLRGPEERGSSGSLSNEAEILAVRRVIRALRKNYRGNLSVAVIAMYQDQVMALRDVLKELNLVWLEVDTVDAFEGEEADVVILSLVRSNEAERIGFLDKAQRLNVAISRAKRLLVVVGDIETVAGREGQDLYRPLLEHVQEHGRVAGIGALRAMETGHRPKGNKNGRGRAHIKRRRPGRPRTR